MNTIKKIIEELLEQEHHKLAVMEIRARFTARKQIEHPGNFEKVLAAMQAEIRGVKEFIKFLEEIKEE